MASISSVRDRPDRLMLRAVTVLACLAFGSVAGAQDAPSAVGSATARDVAGEVSDDAESFAPEDAAADRRSGQSLLLKDGDFADAEPPPSHDGVLDMAEPVIPDGGVDGASLDTRPRDEVALFENPALPPDPLLFQIEDTDPILDRRPARLFRFEPYDPVGIRRGSFVFFPEVELSGDATSNVFHSPQARSNVAFDVRPSARLVSNWQRHALEFRATGIATFYNEFSTENDKAYTLEARGRLDITQRANLQAVVTHDVAQESRTLPDARNVGTRADITTDRLALAFNQRFNRLTVQLRGSVTETGYGDTTTAGVATSNTYRDYTGTEQAVRATWEFKPTLQGFTEVALNQRAYGLLDPTGINRSSTGERYRLGLAFGSTGEILRGEASLGYGTQRPANRSYSDIAGLIVDANLTVRASALTSVLLSARSDVA